MDDDARDWSGKNTGRDASAAVTTDVLLLQLHHQRDMPNNSTRASTNFTPWAKFLN